ncbi:glycosyltransferase family 2 protein [Halosimplex halophilum]|uniref:glycosyltransferase family 2 protein n=1 Tax=Halosimplex halophilum TaxID=2559572 RepID=UPI00107EF3E8|nr:glycosyltransferase family 2 protein [Halosimplex halophilum]
MDPKVSIIITAHNYAHFLEECLESALTQTYDQYEVIVVDDGSTDETPEILRAAKFEYPERLHTIRLEGEGLPSACNAGIEAADGEYVVRLDADDFFDENILTVESTYLDANPEIDLVFPDYYTVDSEGEILNHVRMLKVQDEVKLLNRAPLAAGAMYRKEAWEAIGGYNESLSYQEDYDFWVRFVNRFNVRNVNLPLMYYRQHNDSMSQNLSGRLEARRNVKDQFVDMNLADEAAEAEVLGVVPAQSERRIEPPESASVPDAPLALWEVDNQSLLDYTVTEMLEADRIDRLVVSTESEEIATAARKAGAEVPHLRPDNLVGSEVSLSSVIADLLTELRTTECYDPDFVVLLQYVSPLKTAINVDEVVDTWHMFSVDSVISVTENRKFLWQPGKYGLEPLFEERLLREERETLYEENGAIYGFEPSIVHNRDELTGDNVGHVLMEPHHAIHIDTWFDLKMCEKVLDAETNGLRPSYQGLTTKDE